MRWGPNIEAGSLWEQRVNVKGPAQLEVGGEELRTWALNLRGMWVVRRRGREDDGVGASPSRPHSSACAQPSLSKPWSHHLCPGPFCGPQSPR